MGGLTLKLDREKWGYSVFAAASGGLLGRFFGEDIEVTLRRVAPMPNNERTLVQSLGSRSDVLYVRGGDVGRIARSEGGLRKSSQTCSAGADCS